MREVSRESGVPVATISRFVGGKPVQSDTLDRLSALLDRWDADNVSGFTPKYQVAGRKMVTVTLGPDDLFFPNADILVTEEDAKIILEAQQPSPEPPAREEEQNV